MKVRFNENWRGHTAGDTYETGTVAGVIVLQQLIRDGVCDPIDREPEPTAPAPAAPAETAPAEAVKAKATKKKQPPEPIT